MHNFNKDQYIYYGRKVDQESPKLLLRQKTADSSNLILKKIDKYKLNKSQNNKQHLVEIKLLGAGTLSILHLGSVQQHLF